MSFVDLAQKRIARTELRRFADALDPGSLVDESSAVYRERGLAYMRLTGDEILEHLLSDQRLLRLPLIRNGTRVGVGHDEAAWKALLTGD